MSDLPILFSAPMVRAILREIERPGTGKTQTRRVAGEAIPGMHLDRVGPTGWQFTGEGGSPRIPYRPKHAIGDRLYVREAWHAARSLNSTSPRDIPRDADIEHAATARSYAEIGLKGKLRPAMFLPRWASRITLIVTDVRVQRLQEIDEVDALAEGVREGYGDPAYEWEALSYRRRFNLLWDHLNAARGYGWDANPWVAAYTFRPILGNIDQVAP